MAYQKNIATLADDNLLTLVPSLKRKFDTQQKINFVRPSQEALDDLIRAFVPQSSQYSWLEVERDTVAFALVAEMKPPSVFVCISKNKRKLVLQNCAYTLCHQLNATRPDVRFIEEDMSLPLAENACRPQFNLITCVLSLHHFFKNEESAKNLFVNLSSCLSENGHLVCVFRSGSDLLPQEEEEDDADEEVTHTQKKTRLSEDTIAEEPSQVLKNLLQTLKKTNSRTKKAVVYKSFGSALPVCVERHQEGELLIFRNSVLGVAQACGLRALVDYPAELIKLNHLDANDAKQPFKHFRDSCYGSIVFKKKRVKLISVI